MTTNTTTDPNKLASFGFTTSSTDRQGPPAPYTTTPLQINLFFRVFLGLLSLFITWVPARLLWRNGEFAGTVLCATLLVLNLITVVNALLWRDNNVTEWWSGEGWCDVMNYAYFPLHTAFNICMFEIMRGLAGKVALRRAVQPRREERRRQRVVSAVVIFTCPALQAVMTYFVTFGRFNVGTLVGCAAVYYPGWMYLVVFILPTPVFAVLAAFYAALTFYRYRKIETVTRDIAQSHGGLAAARQDRVRKKLYFMTLVCIVVVLPLVMVLLFVNIAVGAPWTLPYDFDLLHFGPDPFNDAFISFTTTDRMAFTTLNLGYVAELSGIAVFFPFGTTPEALNMYRAMLLGVGLGAVFPKLKDEYVPRPPKQSAGTGWVISWNSLTSTLKGRASTSSICKDSLLPTTVDQISLTTRTDHTDRLHSSSSSHPTPQQPRDLTMSGTGVTENVTRPENVVLSSQSDDNNPWPDLAAADLGRATVQIGVARPPVRNPYAGLGTAAQFSVVRQTPAPFSTDRGTQLQTPHSHQTSPWADTPTITSPSSTLTPSLPTQSCAPPLGVDTRVWAEPVPTPFRPAATEATVKTTITTTTTAVSGSNSGQNISASSNHHNINNNTHNSSSSRDINHHNRSHNNNNSRSGSESESVHSIPSIPTLPAKPKGRNSGSRDLTPQHPLQGQQSAVYSPQSIPTTTTTTTLATSPPALRSSPPPRSSSLRPSSPSRSPPPPHPLRQKGADTETDGEEEEEEEKEEERDHMNMNTNMDINPIQHPRPSLHRLTDRYVRQTRNLEEALHRGRPGREGGF